MGHNPTPQKHEQITVNGIAFSHGDILNVVDDFYTRIQKDPALSIPFQSVHDWPEHIERLTHFWWIRFGGKPYMLSQYNPALKHFFAGFNEELLQRWLMIFHATLQDHLNSEQVTLWTDISKQMGRALSVKNDLLRRAHKENQS